jgi:hypothetical protein
MIFTMLAHLTSGKTKKPPLGPESWHAQASPVVGQNSFS